MVRPGREVGRRDHGVVDGQFADPVADVDLGVDPHAPPHGHVVLVRAVQGEQVVANQPLQLGHRRGDRERRRTSKLFSPMPAHTRYADWAASSNRQAAPAARPVTAARVACRRP